MKLKPFLLSLFFLPYINPPSFSQRLRAGTGEMDTAATKHLAFESNKGDSILYLKGYSVIFSYRLNLPLYTFNLLTVDQLTADSARPAAKRSTSFYPYTLPNGTVSATHADYKKSGYDRGHMVPAGDFVWNKELKDETFYYVNINPQTPGLNRGIWANLENAIRNKVLAYGENAHIVTGAVFDAGHGERIGPNGLCVPVVFFKMVYFDACQEMFAFMFDNTVEKHVGDIRDFQVTVDVIEQITGEDFFDVLDDDVEATLESVILKF